MKNLFIRLITFGLIASCKNQSEKEAINNLSLQSELINQSGTIHQFCKLFPKQTQLSIAVIKNGRIYYEGVLKQNDTLISINNSNSHFEIGSITKVFTATLLANFILNKEIEPDSPINSVFPYPFHQNLSINYRELANHTSGLPSLPSNFLFTSLFNPSNPYAKYTEDKLDQYLKNKIKLEYPKGSKSEYSNLGMGLLAYTLKKHSGKSFENLLNDFILKKYQMNRTGTVKEKVISSLVVGQDEDGKPTSNWSPGALIGAGGIFSTVSDLAKFALAQFDSTNSELALTRISTFKEDDSNEVGLGWFIQNNQDQTRWYWHNGGTGGYSSCMIIDPKNQNGIIVLSNLSAYHSLFDHIDQLAFTLMKNNYSPSN